MGMYRASVILYSNNSGGKHCATCKQVQNRGVLLPVKANWLTFCYPHQPVNSNAIRTETLEDTTRTHSAIGQLHYSLQGVAVGG